MQRTPKRLAARSTVLLVRRLLRNRGSGVRGVAAIEFAAMAMVLMVMMIGTVDLGMGFYRKMQVHNAAQAGAHYVMLHGFTDENVPAVANAVRAATSYSAIAPEPTSYRFDGCATAAGVVAADANSKCPDGSTAGSYVSVSARAVYKTVVPLPLLGIPESFVLEARSVVRVQ